MKEKKSLLILIPITKEEQYKIVDTLGDDNLYMLYRRKNSSEIDIGMLSSTMREYYPEIANARHLDEVFLCRYFYGGGEEILDKASELRDRPVYIVLVTPDRKIEKLDILNEFYIEGLSGVKDKVGKMSEKIFVKDKFLFKSVWH